MIGAESIKSKVCSDRSAPGIISVQRDYGCNRPAMLGNEGGMAIFSCFQRIWELVSGVFGSSARCFAHGLPVNEPYSSVRFAVKYRTRFRSAKGINGLRRVIWAPI